MLFINFNPNQVISGIINSLPPHKVEGKTKYYLYNGYEIVVREQTVVTVLQTQFY